MYRELISRIKRELEELVTDGKVVIREKKVNNGIILNGMQIRRDEQDTDWIPVLYIDEMIKANKDKTPPQIAEILLSRYEVMERETEKDMLTLPEYTKEYILENLNVQIVNYEKNKEELNETVYKKYLDLAVIAMIKALTKKGKNPVARITKQMLHCIGISEEEIFERIDAENTPEIYKVQPLREKLMEMMGMYIPDDGIPLTVITRVDDECYGATALLLPELFREIAEKENDDIYIIPSSIHEVLTFPVMGKNPSEIAEMVKFLNASDTVEDEIVLSDNVYKYTRETGEISIAE